MGSASPGQQGRAHWLGGWDFRLAARVAIVPRPVVAGWRLGRRLGRLPAAGHDRARVDGTSAVTSYQLVEQECTVHACPNARAGGLASSSHRQRSRWRAEGKFAPEQGMRRSGARSPTTRDPELERTRSPLRKGRGCVGTNASVLRDDHGPITRRTSLRTALAILAAGVGAPEAAQARRRCRLIGSACRPRTECCSKGLCTGGRCTCREGELRCGGKCCRNGDVCCNVLASNCTPPGTICGQ